MLRDLTLIFSVLVSIVSVAFGFYKNIEAGNSRAFIYEQAYRVLNQVQQANIPSASKAQIIDAALGTLTTPPPVIDLSRSRADVSTQEQVCNDAQKASCSAAATNLAAANAACSRSKGTASACDVAVTLKDDILTRRCLPCFSQ